MNFQFLTSKKKTYVSSKYTYKYIESPCTSVLAGRVEGMPTVRFTGEMTEHEQTRANHKHATDDPNDCKLNKP